MKTYGIICEYNPFHNGHIYQIEETRKHGADHIVAIMSGNYVQGRCCYRGQVQKSSDRCKSRC